MKKIFTLILTLAVIFSASLQVEAQINDGSPFPIDFKIESPMNIAGSYAYGTMSDEWGPELDHDVAGEVAWVYGGGVDADGNPLPGVVDSLGCMPITNAADIAGKMALIRRGNCSFSLKLYNAQVAGAVGAIIVNHYSDATNDANTLVNMAPTVADSSEALVIPAVFVSRATAELLVPEVDGGNTPSAIFDLLNMNDPLGPYAYSTPQSQIIPLDEISVDFFNDSDLSIVNADFTVEITDPMGVVTTFTESGEIGPLGDSTIRFPDYTPVEMGTYSMKFTNDFNVDEYNLGFEITDKTFGQDLGAPFQTITVGDDNFSTTSNYLFDHGSVFLTGPNGATVSGVTFGLANGADLFTDDPTKDAFSVVLYDLDPDGVGFPDGSQQAYSDFGNNALIEFGGYTLTGDEGTRELICVPFFAPRDLKPNGVYMAMVQYNGTNANTGIAPVYLQSGTQATPYLGTTVSSDRLYMAGWAGDNNGVVRLHLDGYDFPGSGCYTDTEDIGFLENNKVNVFPTPANDVVNLELTLENNADEVEIIMVDISGKQLKSYFYQNVKEQTFQFDVNKLDAGTYFMHVVTPEGSRSQKFVVVK